MGFKETKTTTWFSGKFDTAINDGMKKISNAIDNVFTKTDEMFNELSSEIGGVDELVERMNRGSFRPRMHQTYYFIKSDYVNRRQYAEWAVNEGRPSDMSRIEVGNCYRTKEDCEKAIEYANR